MAVSTCTVITCNCALNNDQTRVYWYSRYDSFNNEFFVSKKKD